MLDTTMLLTIIKYHLYNICRMQTNTYQSTANIFKQTKNGLYERLMLKTII